MKRSFFFSIFGLQFMFFQSDSLHWHRYVSIEMQQANIVFPLTPMVVMTFRS
jgi:hypothetical protein